MSPGTIYIELADQVQNMVLTRASPDIGSLDRVRLIISPWNPDGLQSE